LNKEDIASPERFGGGEESMERSGMKTKLPILSRDRLAKEDKEKSRPPRSSKEGIEWEGRV